MKRDVKLYIKEAVWLVVTEEIPRLKPILLNILDDLEREKL